MNWHLKRFDELTTNELYEILRARAEVFVVEQTCVYQDCDLKDQKSWHLFSEENGEIVEATDSLPKSFVLTHEYGMQRVYLTKSNAAALQKRMQRQENLHRNKGVSL